MEIKDVVAIISSVIGISGLAFGLYQYTIAQKWKRSEFAAKHLEELSSDPELELCCKLLDWAVREVPVPDKYRMLTNESKFVHDWRILAEAMAPESSDCQFDWQHMLYRDLFDHFFDYIERINHYIAIKLISESDTSSLKYWLEQIAAPRFAPPDQKSRFLSFIKRYEYDGVTEMMSRFEIPFQATDT